MSARFFVVQCRLPLPLRKSFPTKRFYFIGLATAILCVVFGGRIATMQDAENSAAPPVAAPVAGAQLQRQIAKGANSSLVVLMMRK